MGLLLRNVSKTFIGKKAVDNISLTLDRPGVFGLLGTNGARQNNYNKNVVRNNKER